jgi:hypothetical protein
MDPRGTEINSRRFERVHAAFGEAQRGTSATCWESHYVFAGEPVRIRVVGDTLARHIQTPFAHLRAAGAAPEPRLTIDLWDERESGPPGLSAPRRHAHGKTWALGDGMFAASPDGRIVSHELRGSVAWLDRGAECITGWFATGGDLSLHQRGKPLQMLLALWANDRGLQAVHAGLVARDGRGVLIPARSGSGKSTVALACLEAGYTYIGDDWIGVGRAHDGAPLGYGLYSSTSLEPAHAMRFPRLHAHAIPPRDASELKSLVLLAPLFPGQLGHSATVCALALPRIVNRQAVERRPASKGEALLMLVPSAVFAMRPRSGPEGVERLVQLVHTVPAYWLEIGSDLSEIPQRMDEILADVAAH